MKRVSGLVAMLLAVGLTQALAGSGGDRLNKPPDGVRPVIVDPRQVGPGTISPPGQGFETPLGYEVSRGHNEDLKIATPTGSLGGQLNYDGNTGPLAPSTGGQSNYQGMTQNGWIPYDAAIAVGPSHVVVMTNSQWAAYNKVGGSLAYITQFDPFFGNAAGGGFDPKCFYDASAGKFVLVVVEESNPKALIDIAVSQTSDPTGLWWLYHFDVTLDNTTQTTNWMDFPGLGYNDNAIFVGGDMYSFSNSYKYSKVRVFSKSQLYSGGPATFVDFVNLLNADGTSAFAPKPARCLTSSSSGYVLNTRPGGGSSVTLWRIDNTPTSPTLTRVATVSVGQYAVPPDASQPGTGTLVATGDCRTQDVVYANGTLYTGFTEKIGTSRRNYVAAVRYLTMSSGGTKGFDITYTASGIHLYYPAVIPDGSGNMYMTYSRSSKNEYVSMYQTGMTTSETAIESSVRAYAGIGPNTSGRWGDYSGASPDPSNSGAVWLYGGWANSSNRWATYIEGASFNSSLPRVAPGNGDVAAVKAAPLSFGLVGNYPNPFNPTTMIRYSLKEHSTVHLTVFNALGQQVAELVNGEVDAGYHDVRFDASRLASGVYFYRLQAGAQSETKRLVLTR